jgi:YVTN family beta-propeller protein
MGAHRRVVRLILVFAPLVAVVVVFWFGLSQLVGASGGQGARHPTDAAAPRPSNGPGVGDASATIPTDPAGAPLATATDVPSPSPTPTQTPVPSGASRNVYAGTGVGMFSPAVAGIAPRVYVPDEASGTVTVIDPTTYRIVGRFRVGASPEHVTPDWDLRRLYVEAAFANRLTVIDPRTARPTGRHTVPGPYNLYFTVDGRMAIVVLDSSLSGRGYGGARQVYFYNRTSWRLIKALRIPWAGADHLDFSANGRFALMSTEYAGWLVRIDLRRMAVSGRLFVGGRPIDVRLAPDGSVFYVANQATGGVAVIDPVGMRQIGFIRTGSGAHGLAISRDARQLYVSNRRAGTVSVIDFATRRVIRTWRIGGTPDMIAVSPAGTRLWISNRYGGTVSVVDARNGRLIKVIVVGGRPHGLAYFPEPGSISLGHNGIYR